MATVRLSICEHTFCGDDEKKSGSLTGRLVHPTAPVLLTSNGPLSALHIPPRSVSTRAECTHSEFETCPRPLRPREHESLSLEDATAYGACYPGGHFGGNQLLASSIGLSPLYPRLTIDLHVRTVAGVHQSFPWLHPTQA